MVNVCKASPILDFWASSFLLFFPPHFTSASPSSWCRLVTQHLTLCDPRDCSSPGSLSLGFSRQEYWSGLPFPPPGDLPNSSIKPMSPVLAGRCLTTAPRGKMFKYRVPSLLPTSPEFKCHLHMDDPGLLHPRPCYELQPQ